MYVQVPTRVAEDGAKDKAALISAQAMWTARTNREFLEKVREVVNSESSAEGQVNKWFEFCNSRTYSRENGDVFAHPNSTIKHGGDCDDSAILLIAGIMALGIPVVPDVVLREINGEYNGVHVRARVGFPPHDPPRDMSQWKIYDSSKDGERRWIGGSDIYSPKTESIGINSLTGETQPKGKLKWHGFAFLAVVAAAGLYVKFNERVKD